MEKNYLVPNTVEEAIALAGNYPGKYRFIAGGTDFTLNKFQGNDWASCWIDIKKLPELRGVVKESKYWRIGALITLAELEAHRQLIEEFPLLAEAAKEVAAPVIRKSATLAGNVLCENRCSFYNQSAWWREAVGYCLKCEGDTCIATGGDKNCFSKYSSDMGVALIALDAEVELVYPGGSNLLKLEEIYTGNGVAPRKLPKDAIIKSILIPHEQGCRGKFMKLRERKSLEFSSLSTAVSVSKAGRIILVAGSVDPRPVVVRGEIGSDLKALITQAVKKARIVDNDVFGRKYRKEMMHLYFTKSLQEIIDK